MNNVYKVKHVTTHEWVTPEMAKQWLEMNVANRSLRDSRCDLWAEAMKRGEWPHNGSAIMFADYSNGEPHPCTLIDGQHRLWAVVLSGMTVLFSICRGCDMTEIATLDCGIIRTQGDVLRVTKPAIKDPTMTASVVAVVNNKLFSRTGALVTWETKLILEHFPEEIACVVGYKRRLTKLLPRTVLAALFVSELMNADKTAELVERLRTAVGFTARDPARALYQYLHDQLSATRRDSPEHTFYKTLHACTAFQEGRNLSRLQPMVEQLGHVRNLLKHRIETVVRELHGGRLPLNFYNPRSFSNVTTEQSRLAREAAAA